MDSSTQLPLDSRQLRTFATLAGTGSFTRAAKLLYLSQSAVSHSLKALERDLGCRLFDRVGKKISLTLAGEQLLHHVNKILEEMQVARSSLQHLGHWGKPHLRVGATATACQYILPPVLREFQKSDPGCRLAIEPGDTDRLVDQVRNNRMDLAIMLQPRDEDTLGFIPLFTDELRFLVAPSHEWAKTGQVRREEVSRQNFVLYRKGSRTFQLIEDYFRQQDMVLPTFVELENIEAIKELVKLGLGVGILAPWVARQELKDQSLVCLPLGRRRLKRHWGVVHLLRRPLGLVGESFLTICRRTSRALWPDDAG